MENPLFTPDDILFAQEVLAAGLIQAEDLNQLLRDKSAEKDALPLAQFLIRKRVLSTTNLLLIKKQLESSAKTRSFNLQALSYAIRYVDGVPVFETKTKILPRQQIGKYQILRELGRGGMGVVYAAHDDALKRVVALKTLRASDDNEAVDLERFQREASLAASLQHPNIIGVHDIGVDGKIHYFTMDYIEGLPIGDYVKKNACKPEQIAAMIRDVAEALSFAHGKNIVHRDIKPGNILVDQQGVPHLGDFGLARNVQTSDKLTVSGALIGTPAYMSPEQANGKTNRIGKASDIYSLGAVLYELLVGRPPFSGATLAQTVAAILGQEAIPPRKLVKGLDSDLDTICLKCLEKEPQRRYANARALALDLDRYLHAQPIHARQANWLYKGGKWMRRNKAATALLLLCMLVLGAWLYRFVSPGYLTLSVYVQNGRTTTAVVPELTIDGKKIGRRAITRQPMSPGYHRLSITLADYESEELLVQIAPGKELKQEKQLIRRKGQVTITIAAAAQAIFTDCKTGEVVQFLIPVYQYALPTGDYDVTVRRPNYFVGKRRITIRAGQESQLDFHLQPMTMWSRDIRDGEQASCFTLADVDRDGALDLIVFLVNGSTACYDMASGQKKWRIRNNLNHNVFPVMVRDFNSDGCPDFALVHHDTFMLIDGDSRQQIFSLPQFWGTAATLGDVNGDGYDDVVLMRTFTGMTCYDMRHKKLLWQNQVPCGSGAPPIWLDGNTILHSADGSGKLAVTDVRSGAVKMIASFGQRPASDLQMVRQGDRQFVLWYSHDAGLVCFDWKSQQIVWRFARNPFHIQNFAVHDANGDGKLEVFLALDRLHCLDLVSGREIWQFDIRNKADAAFVYVADLDGDYIAEVVVHAPNSKLYVLNGSTGEAISEYEPTAAVNNLIAFDVNGDGQLELLFTDGASLHCIRHRPNRQLRTFDQDPLLSSGTPLVADLDRDGHAELIAGNRAGELFCLDGKSWEVRWKYLLPESINNTPVLADIDGDGKNELLVHAHKTIFALALDGRQLWSQTFDGNQGGQQPLVGDFNRDGALEVITTTSLNGIVHCLDGKTGRSLWQTNVYRIFMRPQIADIDNDGEQELVVTSSVFFSNENCGYVHCLRTRDGQVKWRTRIPSFSEGWSEITLRDINGDKVCEIFVSQVGGQVSCLSGKGGSVIWQRRLKGCDVRGFPVVEDVDNDGRQDAMFFTADQQIHCLDAASGEVKWQSSLNKDLGTLQDIHLSGQTGQLVSAGEDLDADNHNDFLALTLAHPLYLFSGKQGLWLADANHFGQAQTGLVFADINGDGKRDMVLADDRSALHVIYDVKDYLRKLTATPVFIHSRHQDAALLWQAWFSKLASHRSYARLAAEIDRADVEWEHWHHMRPYYQGICALATGKQGEVAKSAPTTLRDAALLKAIAMLNEGQSKQAAATLVELLRHSVVDFDRSWRRHQQLLSPDGKSLWRKLLPSLIESSKCDSSLYRAYEYTQASKRHDEAQLFLELSLKYGLPTTPEHKERQQAYLQTVMELLNKVRGSVYGMNFGFNILEHALDVMPDHPLLLLHLGDLHISAGMPVAQGMELIDRALAIDPNQTEVLFTRAGLRLQQSNYQAALADLDNCLRLAPKRAEIHLARVMALLLQNETGKAKLAMQTMKKLALEPGSAETILAAILDDVLAQNLQAARQKMDRSLNLPPSCRWMAYVIVRLVYK